MIADLTLKRNSVPHVSTIEPAQTDPEDEERGGGSRKKDAERKQTSE